LLVAAGNLLATTSGDLVYLGENCLTSSVMQAKLQGSKAVAGCTVQLTHFHSATDFGMMSSAPKEARLAIIAHVTHLVNRDYDVS
jgi:predicted unusual protein kinase regulating ubiquinone biosynthesis (AarF/ABC1/UbiB family)